jgi:hypothetical protein
MKGLARTAKGQFTAAKTRQRRDRKSIALEKKEKEVEELQNVIANKQAETKTLTKKIQNMTEERNLVENTVTLMKANAAANLSAMEEWRASEGERLGLIEKSLTKKNENVRKETRKHRDNIVKKMIKEKGKRVEVERRVADLEAAEAQTFFEERKRAITSTAMPPKQVRPGPVPCAAVPRKKRKFTGPSDDTKKIKKKDKERWAVPLFECLDAHFATDQARRAAVEHLYEIEFENKMIESLTACDAVDSEMQLGKSKARRIMRIATKIAATKAGETLPFLLEALPSAKVQSSLPDTVIAAISRAAELKCVQDVQQMYDVGTCLNLEMKNFLSKRKWQRMPCVCCCHQNSSTASPGRQVPWVRNTVGTTNVPAPMLPEHPA